MGTYERRQEGQNQKTQERLKLEGCNCEDGAIAEGCGPLPEAGNCRGTDPAPEPAERTGPAHTLILAQGDSTQGLARGHHQRCSNSTERHPSAECCAGCWIPTVSSQHSVLVLDDRVLLAFSTDMPHSPMSLFSKLSSTSEPFPSIYYMTGTGHGLYHNVQVGVPSLKTPLT